MVTANKALIAEHGAELAALAEANDAPLLFEAAVMGGTPAVKMLREAMVGDEVEAVAGILNGTCNYILTEMEATGPRRSPTCSPRPSAWATPRPTRPWTSAASTRRTRSPSWPRWRSAARPTYAAAEIEGIDADRAARHPPGARTSATASSWSPAPVQSADGRRRSACIRRWRRSAIRWPQTGGRAQRALHRGPADRPHLHPGAGRRRRADRRGGRRRHRRRDDRRAPAGVPAAGRAARSRSRRSTPAARSAAPTSA